MRTTSSPFPFGFLPCKLPHCGIHKAINNCKHQFLNIFNIQIKGLTWPSRLLWIDVSGVRGGGKEESSLPSLPLENSLPLTLLTKAGKNISQMYFLVSFGKTINCWISERIRTNWPNEQILPDTVAIPIAIAWADSHPLKVLLFQWMSCEALNFIYLFFFQGWHHYRRIMCNELWSLGLFVNLPFSPGWPVCWPGGTPVRSNKS